MGVYSKALHHVDRRDFRKTRQNCLDEKKFLHLEKKEEQIKLQLQSVREEIQYLKLKEQKKLEKKDSKVIVENKVKVSEGCKSNWREELYSKEIEIEIENQLVVEEKIEVPEHLKSNWRKELTEGMTTGGQEIQFAPSDIPLDSLDAADPASFTAANGGFDATFPQDGLMGATIVSNGTGSGNNGGFNLGKSYLSFNGTGYDISNVPGFDNTRAVILTPFDNTRATTLEITAIVGNGSNGGEAPGVDQDIQLWYTDPNGDSPNALISAYDDENYEQIIAVPYNGSSSLRTYSVTIPSYLRKSGISFVLLQSQGNNPSLTGDNYGITEVKLKRTVPVSVMAPLDTPEAVSFFRVGPTPGGPNYETPEQRYRRVMQQMLASQNYTNQMFGSNYPGSNFSGLRGVSASPLGRDGMLSAWGSDIVPTGAWGDYLPPGSLGRDSGIVPTGAWGDYFPPGTFGRADIGSGMGQGMNPAMGQGMNPAMGQGMNPAMGQGMNPATFTRQQSDAFMSGFNSERAKYGLPPMDNWGRVISSLPPNKVIRPGMSGAASAKSSPGKPSQKNQSTSASKSSKTSGPLATVKAASLAAAASKIAPSAKSYAQKGMLNPLGQRPTVRSGAAGRERVDVYRGRPTQGELKFGPGQKFSTTNPQTGATYTNPGAAKGVPGTGGFGKNVAVNPKGTLDKGTLPQRYIDKYGGRSVLGQQQIKMSPSAAAKTFGGTVSKPTASQNIKSVQQQLKSVSGPATKILSTLGKPGGAGLAQFGPDIFKQGQTGSATYKAVNQAAKVVPGLKANPSTDIGKKAGTAIANFITQKPSSSNLGGPKGTGTSTVKSATTKSQTVGSYKPPAPAPKPTTTARKK